MGKKNNYKIYINGEGKELESNRLCFDYRSTKNIILYVDSRTATIEFDMGVYYDNPSSEDYFVYLVKTAIKRVLIVHTLKYSFQLQLRKVVLCANNEKMIDISEKFMVYSLMTGKLLRKVPDYWKDHEILANFVSTRNSSLNSEVSAVYAYVFAKNKKNELERFMYNWMAFNGYYNSIEGAVKNNDRNSIINLLIRELKSPQAIAVRGTHDQLGKKAMIFLSKESECLSREKIEAGVFRELWHKVKREIDGLNIPGNENITEYGYWLGEFTYYLRCSMFHANKPILLFSFTDEMEYKAMKSANILLEEFLDEHIHRLFQKRNNELKR